MLASCLVALEMNSSTDESGGARYVNCLVVFASWLQGPHIARSPDRPYAM